MGNFNLENNEDICITAILPLYNCEDAVEDAVADIFQQEYENWKLILVDDASDDDTAEICRSLAEEAGNGKIVLIENKESIGAAGCYQRGMEEAEGYVLLLDPTDGIEPEMFETIAAAAKRQLSDVIVFGIVGLQYTLDGELRQEVEHAIPTRFWKNDECHVLPGEEGGAGSWNETISELSEQRMLELFWNKAYSVEFMRENDLIMDPDTWETEEVWTEEVLSKVSSLTVLGDILYDRIFWFTEEEE